MDAPGEVSRRKARFRQGVWFLLAPALLAIALVRGPSSHAEALWSDPVVVFTSRSFTSLPLVEADPSGDVHLIFVTTDERQPGAQPRGVLMYARLHEGQWSQPLNILVSPDGGLVDDPALVLDAAGVLHVAWKGAEIYYSHAHVSQAGEAIGWSQPQPVSEGGGAHPALVTERDGSIDVVYARPDGEISYRRSSNGGQTWTSARTVSNTRGSNSAADSPRIAADRRGGLHVVWTELLLPSGWPPTASVYSRSTDGGQSWSPPLRMAGQGYGLINVVTAGAAEVHLIWHAQSFIGENWHRWSRDGGETWSQPLQITPTLRSGFTGYSAASVDSAGILNLVTSANGRGGKMQDVYYIAWDGSAWSEPTLISQRAVGRRSIEQPWITVGGGNRLHAVFEDDFQRIWYTSRLNSAPSVPLQPVPTLAPAPTVVRRPVSAATPAISVAGASTLSLASTPSAPDAGQRMPAGTLDDSLVWHPLLVGAVAPLLVLGVAIARRLWPLQTR